MTTHTMPIFPYFISRDNGVTGHFLINIFRVYDDALGQYHWHTWLHLGCELDKFALRANWGQSK